MNFYLFTMNKNMKKTVSSHRHCNCVGAVFSLNCQIFEHLCWFLFSFFFSMALFFPANKYAVTNAPKITHKKTDASLSKKACMSCSNRNSNKR